LRSGRMLLEQSQLIKLAEKNPSLQSSSKLLELRLRPMGSRSASSVVVE
jgi:hypothetical protein